MDTKSRNLVMGKLFLKNKDYKMAEKSFSEYLSSSPEDYQALKMLAQVQEHLNDTAKAFDLYQRCYLTQPDRKGVLLDICRLLLIRDSRLDHVDQKKWLKLAAQSFPTNPIVTNLLESLPNSQDSHPGRITTEDMILEKLTSLEDRFRNFEDRLKNIEDKVNELILKPINPPVAVPAVDTQPPAVSAPTAAPIATTKIQSPFNLTGSLFGSDFKASLSAAANQRPPHKTAQNENTNTPDKSIEVKPTDPTSKPTNQPSVIPLADPKPAAQTKNPFNITGGSLFGESLKNNVLSSGQWASPVSSAPKPDKDERKNIEGKLTDFTLKQEAQTESSLTGVNLFAESLRKMNLPSEGQWTKGYDADDNDSEVVHNEELPIENFCDMKPIEIKTGEEDEDIVFEFRCKLFRFRDKEYKERGLGNIKVLKHKENGKGRLIMRREQINLVCLNCHSCTKIERVRENQVRFAALDVSDGEPETTIFLAKFGTKEKTDEFQGHLTDLFD